MNSEITEQTSRYWSILVLFKCKAIYIIIIIINFHFIVLFTVNKSYVLWRKSKRNRHILKALLNSSLKTKDRKISFSPSILIPLQVRKYNYAAQSENFIAGRKFPRRSASRLLRFRFLSRFFVPNWHENNFTKMSNCRFEISGKYS